MTSKRRNSELVKLARSFRASASVTGSAITNYLSALNCPRSLTVYLLYENNEFEQLVSLDIDPLHYNDAYQFRDAYAATTFLSKADFIPLSVSKKDAAFDKFFKYEELCRATNSRFMNIRLDPLKTDSSEWLLNATIRKISTILGEFSSDEVFDNADWGPGVTTKLKGCHVSAVNKFHFENGITRDLYSLVGDSFPIAYPTWYQHLTSLWGESCWDFVVGNSIVTVPKSSKTDRVIAVEPGINLWFQKSAGSMIRRRLRRVGIDLNSQKRNQLLAKKGSIDSSLATVDFSSASDSIARELVRALLPPRWFSLLDCMRSKVGVHNSQVIRWEKFSSMGNGFTFELESLIFYAAALAVCEFSEVSSDSVSVFGDDVIIPNECYDLFSKFCEFLGFRVNLEKSFSSSGFRESCGAHWFLGIDCKPIFLKERLHHVQSLYKLANSIRWLSHRRNSYYGCDIKLRGCWKYLLQRIPGPLRFWSSVSVSSFTKGNESLGDVGLIENFDQAVPSRASHGIEGFYTSQLVSTGVSQPFDGTGLLLARIRSQSLQEYGNNYTLRGRAKIRVIRILVPQWYNLGPWI